MNYNNNDKRKIGDYETMDFVFDILIMVLFLEVALLPILTLVLQ
jgi:hypothetical protein